MTKGKYTSKFTNVTAELFNDYYEDTPTVENRKNANNATSKQKNNSVSTKQNKAVSSKPQQKKVLKKQNSNANKKVITNSLKQTACFLNNQQRYQEEFPTLGQSYKSQKPQQQQQQQIKQKPQQLKKQPQKISNKLITPKTYISPATYTTKQTEELLRQFYAICQSYNGINYYGKADYQTNNWSKNSRQQWVNTASTWASKNAPVALKKQKQSEKQSAWSRQPIQQKTRQASIKKQPSRMSKQSEEELLREFNDICQCYDGMNYFGKSSYQSNTWSSKSGNWVNSASNWASKNAPVVLKTQKQSVWSRQPTQQKARQQQQKTHQASIKKQSSRMSKQSKEELLREFNEEEILREFNDICQCYDGMNYFGKSSYQFNTWSSKSGNWVNSASNWASKNAPVVLKTQKQSVWSRQPTQQKARQQQQKTRQASIKKQSSRMSKQSKEELLREFNDICQCYDGMNYFGKSSYQSNTWSSKSGNWVNSASNWASKNAPVVLKTQKQSVWSRQPAQQKARQQQQKTRQASIKKQPTKMSKQSQEELLLEEFISICQCYSGMNYFGKSAFQSNTWSLRSGEWVSTASSIASKNAPVVQRVQQKARQAPIKKQSVQQRKKQQRKMKPVVNNEITIEQRQMNQNCIIAQQNASLKLQNQILKQHQEKQEQLEKKKKLEEEQQQQQMKLQKKNSQRKMQSVKQNVKQPQSLKKQQQIQKKRNLVNNNKKLDNTPKNVKQMIANGMTRSQAKKIHKKQQLILKINKRIQELVAEKHQKQLFSQMVKQKAQQILEEKHEASIQKSMNNIKKQAQGNKLVEKESYEKQQKQIQKKLSKQKKQIKNKINNKSSALEIQKKNQLTELKNNLTPQQLSKLQSIMQQNGNNTAEQNSRQLQSEQDKKGWQEQVKKMKARQQEVQQKLEKQALIKKRFENIKRKLTPKQQENLMNKLKLKEQQKMKKDELKNHQPRANNNNKKFAKKQAPLKQAPVKQAPIKQQPIKQQKWNKKQKKPEIWTFVNNSKKSKVQKAAPKPVQQMVNKGVKQSKTVSSRNFTTSETRMFNNEFSELCNCFETTTYTPYSNYMTWSKNISGNYVSNASIISARNAPRITRGGLFKQMNFGGKKSKKNQNSKPQQVRNKSSRSKY